jgi:outer membrane protein OmpA-like peptidoglycan-associated protein
MTPRRDAQGRAMLEGGWDMRIAHRLAFVFVGLLCLTVAAFAQDDVDGAKDHPLITRMPGYYIAEYIQKEFDSIPFRDSQGKEGKVEGKYYYIDYLIKDGAKSASDVQIIRNYINALQKIGGKVVYQPTADLYMKIEKGGGITWVHVTPFNGGDGYDLEVVEEKAMAQYVSADAAALNAELAATGHVAVYGITFEGDKADLRTEAQAAIAEVAKLLKQNPSLKLFVVGHTANVGDVESGLKLSQARAAAVVKALTTEHGIAADRLKPYGAGPYCPVASNATEEGRAKNRRVELVQQ